MSIRRRAIAVCIALAWCGGVATISGCSDDAAESSQDCDVIIEPSDDDRQTIQAMLSEPPGEVVCLQGAFELADTLTLPGRSVAPAGLTLRGLDTGATLDFLAQRTSGTGSNGIAGTNMARVTLENLTVRNTAGDGIRIDGSERVVFRDVRVSWDGEPRQENGAYGIYPVNSEHVLVEHCEASGASDAGIYVGQSRQVIVRNNLAHGNVAGIEVENCTDVDVHDNEATDNTAGILVFDLPELPAGMGARTRVFENLSHANNRVNFATPGTTVSFVPHGLGMMLLATRDCDMFDNEIRDNQSTGLLVLGFDLVAALDPQLEHDDADYVPYPSAIHVHDNTFSGNGTMPESTLGAVVGGDPVEDIVWDGWSDPENTGLDPSDVLCLGDNGGASFRNLEFSPPLRFGDASLDDSVHACSLPALPAIALDL